MTEIPDRDWLDAIWRRGLEPDPAMSALSTGTGTCPC
jgi:hypothetical protein